MDGSHLLLIVLIYVVPIALGLLVLFFVVRAAVLSALRKHHAEIHSPTRTTPTES